MEDKSKEGQVLGRAYAIFLEELRAQLLESKLLFSVSESMGVEDCENLRSAFHKIKGGAGFFQLTEVARLGAGIEAILKQGPDAANAARDEIRESLFEIEKQLP